MTRHLSLVAFVFGLVSTGSIALASNLYTADSKAPVVRTVELERVTITAPRLPADQ